MKQSDRYTVILAQTQHTLLLLKFPSHLNLKIDQDDKYYYHHYFKEVKLRMRAIACLPGDIL